MSNRTKYQRQMDQTHLSKEKANETLRLMLEENRRLREREAARPSSFLNGRRALTVGLPALACLALLLILPQALRGGSPAPFPTVQMSTLPAVTASRGDDGPSLTLEEAFGRGASDLFPGWTAGEAQVSRSVLGGASVSLAEMQLEKGDARLTVQLSTIEPPLLTVLRRPGQQDGVVLEDGVYPAQDPDTGLSYAVFERDGLYYVFSSPEPDGQAFLRAVRDAAGL